MTKKTLTAGVMLTLIPCLILWTPRLLAQDDPDAAPDSGAGKPESLQQQVDEAIRRQVVETLKQDRDLEVRKLRVSVSKGAVTLYGRVNTPADKHLASRYAEQVDGTEGIINRIMVLPGMDQPDPGSPPGNDSGTQGLPKVD